MATTIHDAAGSDPILQLQANGSGTEKVTVKSDGSVGLGTTTPLAKLHNTGDFITKGPWYDVRAYGILSSSTQATTGGITSGRNILTVLNAMDFAVGQGICVRGAGANNDDLTTTIQAINGTQFTLNASAQTTVSTAAVLHNDGGIIQEVIAYLQSMEGVWDDTRRGGIVFLPVGTYNITSPINIGEGVGGTKFGHGIQIVGAGPQATILKITSPTAISAIRINGVQDGTSNYCSLNVVIRDLKITMEQGGPAHIGIENILGTCGFFQNVVIVGRPYFEYGIKATGWTNVYDSCCVGNVSRAGIYLTGESLPGGATAANASDIIGGGVTGYEASSSENAYGILVEKGSVINIIGCTIQSGYSAAAGKNIAIGVGGEEAVAVLMKGNYVEGGDIGIELNSKGHTVIGGSYGGDPGKFRFLKIDDPAVADGTTIMNVHVNVEDSYAQMSRFYGNIVCGGTGTEEGTGSVGQPTEKFTVLGNADIACPDVLGPESLSNGDFSSGSTDWTVSSPNEVKIMTGGTVLFAPHIPTSLPTLSQARSDMAVPGVGNRWYKLEYTIAVPPAPGQTTTGSITSGQNTLTVANAMDFADGQVIGVKGAGAGGVDLITAILSGGGTPTLTLVNSAGTTVPNEWNPFPAVLHTTTGNINSGQYTLTVTDAMDFAVGQAIRVQGAGGNPGSGDDLITTIQAINGTQFTLNDPASTTVSGATVLHCYSANGCQAFVLALGHFAAFSARLNVTPGTHVLYFKSAASPNDFVIYEPPVYNAFILDNLSLKEIQGGNLSVAGAADISGRV
jgi:hypothetical protein